MCVCVQVLVEEGMVENAAAMEGVVRRELAGLDPNIVMTIRGRGLFFAIVIKPTEGERSHVHNRVAITMFLLPSPLF